MNIVAIVQARMGSGRLPGKILKDIEARPMLWHVINRLKACRLLNKIVVATSVSSKDDCVEEFCRKNNIEFYRGNEEDVLGRYYQTAKTYEADVVVRITGDCPLIDPQICDRVISEYLRNKDNYDGASNTIKRTFPRGFDTEVFSISSLEKIWMRAEKDYQREHVTFYAYEHPEEFRLCSVEDQSDFSYLRLTIDEEADFKLAKEIFGRLYREGSIFLMNDILKLLDAKPHLLEINKDVKQKSVVTY